MFATELRNQKPLCAGPAPGAASLARVAAAVRAAAAAALSPGERGEGLFVIHLFMF